MPDSKSDGFLPAIFWTKYKNWTIIQNFIQKYAKNGPLFKYFEPKVWGRVLYAGHRVLIEILEPKMGGGSYMPVGLIRRPFR